jgi:integrase
MTLILQGSTYHSRIMHEGQFHWKSLRTGNRQLATKREALIKTQLYKGEFGILDSKGTGTLAGLTEKLHAHWDTYCKSPRTAEFYKQNLKVLNSVGFLSLCRLHRIDQALIEKFVQRRRKDEVAVATVNGNLNTLSKVLHYALDKEMIGKVPKIRMLTGVKRRTFVLTDVQIDDMIKLARKQWPSSVFQFLLPFLCDTGLRIGEACGLKVADIDFVDGMPVSIRITKGKSASAVRTVPLTERAALNLAAALKVSRCDYAWTSVRGCGPLHRRRPSQQFKELGKQLNLIGAVLHSTRHTFCSRLGEMGAPAFTLMKLAGHSDVRVSEKYVHPDDTAARNAIELLNTPKGKV